MRIDFTLTEDDIVAFSQHQYKNSRSIRLTLRILYITLPAVLFIISIFVFRNTTDDMTRVLVSSAITTVLFAFIFWILLKINLIFIVPRLIKGMVNRDPEKSMIGSCSIEILNDNLVETLNGKIISLKADALDRLEESDTHLFLFISSTVALIIPKHKLSEEEVRNFTSELNRKLNKEGI